MKISKLLRNAFIATISHIGITALYRNSILKQGPLVRVVVFHDVRDADWFSNTIAHIATTHNIVSPKAFQESRFSEDKINILITFDDGYASWTQVAQPILARRNILGIFFTNSGLLNTFGDARKQGEYVHKNLLLSSRETLSWEDLQKLHIDGHTVGGHTLNHMRLSTLPSEMQDAEIRDDRKEIETKLGFAPVVFAYPFGRKNDYTEDTKQIVKENGYTYAFTTESDFVNFNDSFAISRMCIEDGLSKHHLEHWITGGYDLYAKMKQICAR